MTTDVISQIKASYPWLSPGLLDQIRVWAAEPGVSVDQLVAQLRQSQPYRERFAGMFRADGTMRMNEAEYLDREAQYKQVLVRFNRGEYEYKNPKDLQGFFESDMDPQELQQRLQKYEEVKQSSQDVRDAFYVYAGMKLSDDDLYLMAVNPTNRDKYVQEYNKRVALQPIDYQTWITRATEAGLDRVANSLNDLHRQGAVTGDAIDTVRRLDPAFAKQIADALYHGGSVSGPFLSLSELMNSFEYAMIGGAAVQSGIDLPSEARVAALRQAGIDGAKAREGYSAIAQNRQSLQGGLDRMRSGRKFTTQDFEKAVFMNSAPEEQLLQQAQAYDKSLAQEGGGAVLRPSQSGRITQPGLESRN